MQLTQKKLLQKNTKNRPDTPWFYNIVEMQLRLGGQTVSRPSGILVNERALTKRWCMTSTNKACF